MRRTRVYDSPMARKRSKRGAKLGRPPAGTNDRDHMARVHVSDQVWSEFRAAAGRRSISLVLGDLVQREVDRHRSQQLRAGSLDDVELLEALERARELHDEQAELVARIERRLDWGKPKGTSPSPSER